MELLHKTTNINFMGSRKVAVAVSLLALVVSIYSLATRELNLGIDFAGGVLLEVGYPDSADIGAIRGSLDAAGFPDAAVQNFGTSRDVLIRLLPGEEDNASELGDRILNILRSDNPNVELRRIEVVGPQVGEELREQGGLAMLFALLMIMAYVTFRFQ